MIITIILLFYDNYFCDNYFYNNYAPAKIFYPSPRPITKATSVLGSISAALLSLVYVPP